MGAGKKAHPHSDALRVTERFRRTDFGHMKLAITIDDPKAYRKPWTANTTLNLQADTELLEAFCDDHQKTMEHRQIAPPVAEPPSQAGQRIEEMRQLDVPAWFLLPERFEAMRISD